MSLYSEMYNNADFPVIVTRGVIIFPEQDIIIDVGRKLSVNALNKAREKYESLIWVVTQKDVMVEDPDISDIYSFGTLCSIKHVRQDSGIMKVKFHGLARAQGNVITKNEDMFMANITAVDDIYGDDKEESVLVKRVLEEFEQISVNFGAVPKELINHLSSGVSSVVLADQFGQYLPMSLADRQEILEALDVNNRLMLILQQFEVSREIKQVENDINERVKDSIDENQKEYYLRERLKAIKRELGDDPGDANDIDALRERFENNPYPENVKKKAKDEINRLEMMSSGSPEAAVIRNYLDWIEKIPWWQQSEDRDDINEISRILEEDHYGLEKPKERTYLGSIPGRIIHGMTRAGTINPVFLIDEIDKLGSDYKGDPSSAMLEVLDPEQNNQFSDNFIEEPYDLSKVLFIATANDLYSIPDALRDRLEIIEMSSYTEDEKLHIALDHLIKKVIEANGLTSDMFKLNSDEILYIIRHYTREAGVRQLERAIGKLCRKTALAYTKGDHESVTITVELIQKWLGKELFEFGEKEKEDQVGVATGLAYTSFGGDILPIEVTYFDGKGGLIITGQLGDVMKESATIAVGYVKSNAERFGIDPKFFESHDIHIHVPEGAVPKDGPSAGITLTTAVVSA